MSALLAPQRSLSRVVPRAAAVSGATPRGWRRLRGGARASVRGWRAHGGRGSAGLTEPQHDITRLLVAMGDGASEAREARERLIPLVYDELRVIARSRLRRESGARTVSATELVHEAYLRLLGPDDPGFQNRAHFFAAAAEAMRRVLIDRARRRQRLRHGGGRARITLDDALHVPSTNDRDDDEILAVDEALSHLQRIDPRGAQVVLLRTFGGLTVEETARVMDLSPRSVKREWACARAWLTERLGRDGARDAGA